MGLETDIYLPPILRSDSGTKTEPLSERIWRGVDVQDVTAGDIYRFTFRLNWLTELLPGGKAGAVAAIRENLEKNATHYAVENVYQSDKSHVIAYLRVVDNPLPFILVFGIVVTGLVGSMIMFGLQVEKVERVISSPQGAVIGILAAATVAIAAFRLLFR